jgi:hypothetical protein
MTRPHPYTHWIRAGRLLAGAYPGHRDPAQAKAKLNRFLEFGVRHFVDLTEAGERKPYEHVLVGLAAERRIRVTYRRIPIRDVNVPASVAVMRDILDAIERGLGQAGITYVHCRGGQGRTGLTVACWLQEQGQTPETALAEVGRCWETNPKSQIPGRQRSPGTTAQENWVRDWPILRTN